MHTSNPLHTLHKIYTQNNKPTLYTHNSHKSIKNKPNQKNKSNPDTEMHTQVNQKHKNHKINQTHKKDRIFNKKTHPVSVFPNSTKSKAVIRVNSELGIDEHENRLLHCVQSCEGTRRTADFHFFETLTVCVNTKDYVFTSIA